MADEAPQGVPEDLRSSPEALRFLSSIEPSELELCLFRDSLVTVSDRGREVGELSIHVESASLGEEPCYLLRANSHGAIDDVPCGTSITAYLSASLETLEQRHQEYVKLHSHTLNRDLHMVRTDKQLVVTRVVSEGEDVRRHTTGFPLAALQGFMSEASSLLIQRILARRRSVPEHMLFLSLDAEARIAVSAYRKLGEKQQVVGMETVRVFGIERTLSSEEHPATWHCYFLSDGQLASRVQVGSPVSMRLLQLPAQTDRDEPAPVFERKPLVWEEDMELYSKFLDRKGELQADHSSYVRQHPELKAMMADFLQLLLLRKPQDIFCFAQDYFVMFSSRRPPDSSLKTSRTLRASETQRADQS